MSFANTTANIGTQFSAAGTHANVVRTRKENEETNHHLIEMIRRQDVLISEQQETNRLLRKLAGEN